ncbi:MAG: hypothetical protein WCK74_01935 [Gemmatimonadaceae bacterium]
MTGRRTLRTRVRRGMHWLWSMIVLLACAGSGTTVAPTTTDTGVVRFKGEAWADNWFALYRGDQLLAEDAVPITTERSFNAETFTFDGTYPFTLAFVLKDYIENASGLEYIGKSNQQIGDGGFIFQLTDVTHNKPVLVSSSAFKCLVVQKAPLNPSCEKDANPLQSCQAMTLAEPAGWKAASFNDSAWPAATEHTAAAVGPKDGYLTINWQPTAKFIWSADLKLDNTVLCRVTVNAP